MLSEYSSDNNNDKEILNPNKKKNKVKISVIKSDSLNGDGQILKDIEDPFEEYNNFIPNEENHKIFEEHNDFNPFEKVKEPDNSRIKAKEIAENSIIRSFPKKARNIICEEIYKKLNEKQRFSHSKIVDTIIEDLNNIKANPNWISKITEHELNGIRIKLTKNIVKNEIESSFSKYLHELTNLVEDIKKLNEEDQSINFTEISFKLIKQGRSLNLTKRGLEEAISGVYNHFEQNFDDFNLKRAKRRAISGTESEKESIRCLRKEYKLLVEMENGKYGGKCSNSNCSTDFKRLPAFDFHHEDSKIKTTSWNEIMHKKYNLIKDTLESQKVKPICKNCHLPKNAKIFNDFKDLILKKDLFIYSSKKIDNILNLKVEKFDKENDINYTVASLKFEVKRWIKKRAVVEQVFNGECISCGENRLPSLQMHHTDKDIKVHKWGDISRKWNIRELINDFIIEEECVCLCGNCHAMVNTKNFENNVEKVLGGKYVHEVKADYKKIKLDIMKSVDRIKKIKNGMINLIVRDFLNAD